MSHMCININETSYPSNLSQSVQNRLAPLYTYKGETRAWFGASEKIPECLMLRTL